MQEGELFIEFPDEELHTFPAGREVVVYEYRSSGGLTMLDNVTSLELHVSANRVIEATLTRSVLTDDEDIPIRCETSNWLVRGIRTRKARHG